MNNPDFNGNLPILGQDGVKLRVAPGAPVSFVRRLDENGTYEPEGMHAVSTTQNNIIIGRSNLCSAEDLVDMMRDELREVIREELRRYLSQVIIGPLPVGEHLGILPRSLTDGDRSRLG